MLSEYSCQSWTGTARSHLVSLLTCYFCRICTRCCQNLAADGGLLLQESGKSVNMLFSSQTQKLYKMLLEFSCQSVDWCCKIPPCKSVNMLFCTRCCQNLAVDGGLLLQECGKSVNMLFLSQTQNLYMQDAVRI